MLEDRASVEDSLIGLQLPTTGSSKKNRQRQRWVYDRCRL
jgi:hypothetical protein